MRLGYRRSGLSVTHIKRRWKRKRIKGFPSVLPTLRPAKHSFFSITFSLTLCRQLLLQAARSSSLDRIPSASCKVVRRSRARCAYTYFSVAAVALQQFSPVRVQGYPFSSSPSGLIKKWHAAAADELLAWEALIGLLVGCVRGLVRCPRPS
ncbi:hypothetical protein H4582DRAFT_1247070 [Lactarius indigo]|nr:hypothetical protein H4582DRAFT_1247070 [Lactarius indigo]